MLDTLAVFKEYAGIRRGEDTQWKGDPVLNGESFCARVGRDFGRTALDMCADAEANIADLSDLTGLPPNAIVRFIDDCRRHAVDAET